MMKGQTKNYINISLFIAMIEKWNDIIIISKFIDEIHGLQYIRYTDKIKFNA